MKNPDIEIYIKNVTAGIISNWLLECFESIDIPNLNEQSFRKGGIIQGKVNQDIPVMITPHASGKSFCSIWFKSSQTDWDNDEACAEAFLQRHDTEVRCAASSWTEAEEKESEQWLLITQNEKKLIRWG